MNIKEIQVFREDSIKDTFVFEVKKKEGDKKLQQQQQQQKRKQYTTLQVKATRISFTTAKLQELCRNYNSFL